MRVWKECDGFDATENIFSKHDVADEIDRTWLAAHSSQQEQWLWRNKSKICKSSSEENGTGKAHFHDSEDVHHEGDNHHDPFTKFDNKTLTWTPPDGKFSALDHYIDRCRRSIASRNYTRRPN